MAWNEDIKDAQYTSPSGAVFSFRYGSLQKDTDLKTATFTFPEKDGALVVPLGYGGRRFPLVCSFYGEDCLDLADAFEGGLLEKGYGELQHPIYGTRKVVPTGSISRKDDLVSALNVSTVEITFAETIIDETFPTSTVLNSDEIALGVDAFSEGAAIQFESDMVPGTIAASISAQNLVKNQGDSIIGGLEDLAKKSVSTYTKWQEQVKSFGDAVDNFVNNKIDVARGFVTLCRAPSKLAISVLAKVEGYSTVIRDLMADYARDPAGIENVKSQFVATRLSIESLVVTMTSGVALAMTGGGVIDSPAGSSTTTDSSVFSRGDAVSVATQMAELYDEVVAFFDERLDGIGLVDTGASYNTMRDVVSQSLSLIINYSFTLDMRKSLVLQRDRNFLELVSSLYGSLERVDEFISDNNLNYNELELIPMGREVFYYG